MRSDMQARRRPFAGLAHCKQQVHAKLSQALPAQTLKGTAMITAKTGQAMTEFDRGQLVGVFVDPLAKAELPLKPHGKVGIGRMQGITL